VSRRNVLSPISLVEESRQALTSSTSHHRLRQLFADRELGLLPRHAGFGQSLNQRGLLMLRRSISSTSDIQAAKGKGHLIEHDLVKDGYDVRMLPPARHSHPFAEIGRSRSLMNESIEIAEATLGIGDLELRRDTPVQSLTTLSVEEHDK